MVFPVPISRDEHRNKL